VATDFKHASEGALNMSLFLAKAFQSEIILIHVIPEIRDFQIDRSKIRGKSDKKVKADGDESEKERDCFGRDHCTIWDSI